MGCDIHTIAQMRVDGRWTTMDIEPLFEWRSYGLFAFLAGVRNYSGITPISEPRGIPDGVDPYGEDPSLGDHSRSWLTVAELDAFDYDAMTEDRRVTLQLAPNLWHGGCTCEPGEGKAMTYRDFLGEAFFSDLERLKASGAERIVFGFSS